MLKIAIVEDEKEYARQLRAYLERYEKEQQETIQVIEYSKW